MTKHNPENERIKRSYFVFLKEAKQLSEPAVDAAAKALSRFEAYTRQRNFKAFNSHQAVAFKRHLAGETGQRLGEKLSKATQHLTLKQLKNFFEWLAMQPGYKAQIQYTDYWIVLDVFESGLGRNDWIRTSDLFRVKASISRTFNNLQGARDCQRTRKYVEDGCLAGDFTGESAARLATLAFIRLMEL